MSALLLSGCAARPDAVNPVAGATPPGPTIPLAQLQQMEDAARSRGDIEQVLNGYQRIQVEDAGHTHARTGSARLYLLLGAAHAQDRGEQRRFYQLAQQAAEQALLQDPAFKAAIESGQSVAQAAHSLAVADYEPLFQWVTAVFYAFRDTAGPVERIIRRNRLQEAAAILEHMINTAPRWHDGALQFSLGIYYLSVPRIMGGDRAKARRLMDEAVSMGDQRLLPRWGRAKYLAVALGDRELFKSDLQWVTSRNPSELAGPAIWNAYFQQDARRLLEAGLPAD